MTRRDFLENMDTIGDLLTWGFDNDAEEITQDVYDQSSLSDHLDEIITEMVRYESWQRIRDFLKDIPDDVDYVRFTEYGIEEACFADLRDELLEFGDSNDKWDEEEEEEEEDEDWDVPDTSVLFGAAV